MALAANDMVEVRVNGLCFGQRIVNVLHYWVGIFGIGDTMLQFLDGFRTTWRASALPELCTDYTVASYEGKIISTVLNAGINGLPPVAYPGSTNDPMHPRIRYRDQLAFNGAGAADDGGDAGDPLPTYAAIGIRKVLGALRIPASAGGGTAAGKLMKGSMRLGPVNEDVTELLQGNDLTAGKVASVAAAIEAIRVYNFGAGSTAFMSVISLLQDGGMWSFAGMAGPPRTYTYLFSPVESVTVNPKISSQVSRKERV